MNIFLVAVFSIGLSVLAQFLLKTGMMTPQVREVLVLPIGFHGVFTVLTNKFIFSGFLLYGLGAIVWLIVLSRWDVSKAYPLIGFGFVLTVIIGMALGEQVTSYRVVGVLLISAGVWIVANS